MCRRMARGIFITFEGGEGAGKSTQARLLAGEIKNTGREIVLTREPGGSEGAEEIRHLLVTGRPERWSAMTETLLMYAARRDHIEQVVAPALARGAVVVCDRFSDSTRAYQGAAGGAPADLLVALERSVVGETRPALTLIMNLPIAVGLTRSAARDHLETRFESKGAFFHRTLHAAFLAIAVAEPERCVLIDAAPDSGTIATTIWSIVKARLEAR